MKLGSSESEEAKVGGECVTVELAGMYYALSLGSDTVSYIHFHFKVCR